MNRKYARRIAALTRCTNQSDSPVRVRLVTAVTIGRLPLR
jgi:hypothetical protein